MTKLYLDVPFSRKEEAKTMGAKWDPQEKAWFTFEGNPQRDALLEKFPRSVDERPAGIPLSVTKDWSLPGEDIAFGGSSLFVDLVPSSCWFTNVRSAVAPKHWKAVRLAVLSRAGNRCECCSSHGGHRLECHERWAFDNGSKTQTLKRLVALCSECHETTHFGLAIARNRGEIALQHLMKVNRWTEEAANRHVSEAFALWEKRSLSTWTLDLSIITAAGIAVNEPQDGEYRAQASMQRLDRARSAQSPADIMMSHLFGRRFP
jgi:hypothetical protein